MSPLAMLGADVYNTIGNNRPGGQVSGQENPALESTPPLETPKQPTGILKKPADNSDLDPRKQNEINEKIHKKSHNFPIPLALAILVIWILLSSALFCLWEKDWGFMTSVYFFFVSISTVGLGDIVPSKRDMMIVNFGLILIGLALLSMCIDLIQKAMERFINHLLEEYIKEFEKIAEIINTNDEFTEETLKPFEVDMTDMLTMPLTTIANDDHYGGIWDLGRSAKDWVAEKVADTLLVNRLYPPTYDSESSSESSIDEEEKDALGLEKHEDELKEVVVDDQKSNTGDTTFIPNTLNLRRSSQGSTSTRETFAKDNLSRGSVKLHKKEKKSKQRLRQINPFINYNLGTLRAIQMIETAKLKTGRNSNFKSRLFAKFATNNRLTKLVDERPHPSTKMVSFSVQTSPISGREQVKSPRIGYGVGLGSVDSFSSTNQVTGNDSLTTKSFDIDSLCSSAYYDVNFHGYNTDSMPQIIAQITPPSVHKDSTGAKKTSLGSKTDNPSQPAGLVLIKIDRSTQSPPGHSIDLISRLQKRRSSTANCLPIPTTSSDSVNELPLLRSKMPLTQCPSCSSVATNTALETETIRRVHEICGIMPSDFLSTFKRKLPGSRPISIMSDYDSVDHSFHRHIAPSPPSRTPERSPYIPAKHHQLHRSKRIDDSSSVDAPIDNDRSSLLDSGLGELVKVTQVGSKDKHLSNQ